VPNAVEFLEVQRKETLVGVYIGNRSLYDPPVGMVRQAIRLRPDKLTPPQAVGVENLKK
jgi:hypothetical protein